MQIRPVGIDLGKTIFANGCLQVNDPLIIT